MKTQYFFQLMLLTILFFSCVNENDFDENHLLETNDPNDSFSALQVSETFNYKTSKEVNLSLRVPRNLKNAVFRIGELTAAGDSTIITKAIFADNGVFDQTLLLNATTDTLVIYSDYIGLPHEVKLPVLQQNLVVDFEELFSTRNSLGSKSIAIKNPPKRTNSSKFQNTVTYNYMGTYDVNSNIGVPNYLAEVADIIEPEFLAEVNAMLPANTNALTNRPELFEVNNNTTILTETTDVWVTYVAETTSWRNALGYYTYTLGNEPTEVSEINQHTIIFPHTSMSGSGGGLNPGDKVYLGNFPEGTVIGWFLAANLWYGTFVGQPGVIHYSQDIDTNMGSGLPQQSVSFYDASTDRSVFAFEDFPRFWWADNDFNDAVFYVSTAVAGAVNTSNMQVINQSIVNDEDADGIADEIDDYPFNTSRAFNNYSPSQETTGKLVFEDLWPSTGDYDFNDLALDYRFNLITNADNEVIELEADFTIANIGGSLPNGFGFVLPINADRIASVSGALNNGGYESIAANGTETDTAAGEAVILVCGNVKGKEAERFLVTVTFSNPVGKEELGLSPYNPFLIVNSQRDREVHLPDFPPTSKASRLGSANDDSDVSSNRFYKTTENLPWALNIHEDFILPGETIPIITVYPRFISWANSSGTEDLDWYIE